MRSGRQRGGRDGTGPAPVASWSTMAVPVAFGGALGSLLRWAFLLGLAGRPAVATLLANLVGCFVLGLLVGARQAVALGEPLQAFAGPGFCGGLTTVSGFALATSVLGREDGSWLAGGYVVLSVVVGVLGGACGETAGRRALGGAAPGGRAPVGRLRAQTAGRAPRRRS